MEYVTVSQAFDKNTRLTSHFRFICCDFHLTAAWKKIMLTQLYFKITNQFTNVGMKISFKDDF